MAYVYVVQSNSVSRNVKGEQPTTTDAHPETLSRSSPTPSFGTAKTHQSWRRSRSFASNYEAVLDASHHTQVLTEDLPATMQSEAVDEDQPCFSCDKQSVLCKLHRPHGLPLHSIAERRSHSTLCDVQSTPLRATSLILRHVGSAPESLAPHLRSHSLGNLAVSDRQCTAPTSDGTIESSKPHLINIDHGLAAERDVQALRQIQNQKANAAPSKSSPIQNRRFPSVRSVPDLSPRKTMSDALREVARLLRGHSPSKLSTKSDISTFSMLPPEPLNENHRPDSSAHAWVQEEISPCDVFVEHRRPKSSRRLTVRNRSSLDSLSSSAASVAINDEFASRSGIYHSPPPLFAHVRQSSSHSSSSGVSTPRQRPQCPGYWPSVHTAPVPTSATIDQKYTGLPSTFMHDDDSTSQVRKATSKLGSGCDNFARLRLDRGLVKDAEDPFLDLRPVPFIRNGMPYTDDGQASPNGELHMPSPVRISPRVCDRLSLWPGPTTKVMGLPSRTTKLRSISSMLRVSRSDDTEEVAKSVDAVVNGVCIHGKPVPWPMRFTGARHRRMRLNSLFNSERAQGCWRCELQEFKHDVRKKARSEGYLTMDRRSLRKKLSAIETSRSLRHLIARRQAQTVDPSSGLPQTKQEQSLRPVPQEHLGVANNRRLACRHKQARRCWRCASRFLGKIVLQRVSRICCYHKSDTAVQFRHDRGQKDSSEGRRRLRDESVSPDRSLAPRLRRVTTRSSIN